MKGYWKEMYGERRKDFVDGVIAAMDAYAVWKDGKRYIGVEEQLFEEAVAEVKQELGYPEEC